MKKASGAGLQKEEGVHPTFAEKVECKRQFFTLGDMRIMPCYGLSIQLPRSQGGTQHFFFLFNILTLPLVGIESVARIPIGISLVLSRRYCPLPRVFGCLGTAIINSSGAKFSLS